MNKKLMIIAGILELSAGMLMMIATGEIVKGCCLIAAGLCFIVTALTNSTNKKQNDNRENL